MSVATTLRRLPVPQNAPPPLARLLRACWQEDPAARPGFKDILSVLKVLPLNPAPCLDCNADSVVRWLTSL